MRRRTHVVVGPRVVLRDTDVVDELDADEFTWVALTLLTRAPLTLSVEDCW